MKNKTILYITVLILVFSFSGCEEYLEIPPEAALFDEDIFTSYENFQGFQDEIMERIVDYNRHGARRNHSIGGEAVSLDNFACARGNQGLYSQNGGLMGTTSIYRPHTEGGTQEEAHSGLYTDMWEAVRMANICLLKLEEGWLTNATEDEVNWLEGQALFFRAFWHYEYVRNFGTIPYIDLLIPNGEELNYMRRHWSYEKDGRTYTDTQAVFERVVEDMEAAAELLPSTWPDPSRNYGRPTRLAALGYKAKALQFSASPLFNEQATGVLDYDMDLLARCIAASQAVIDETKTQIGLQPAGMPVVNSDGLTNFEDFQTMYTTSVGQVQPGTLEVLFKKPTNAYGNINLRQTGGRSYGDRQLTNQHGAQGSQQYVDKFEMADGTRYRPEYDQDVTRRWVGRDPRFYRTFYVHGDQISNITLNQSDGQRSRAFNCYVIRKYFGDGVNKDNVGDFCYATPYLRLADIYLTYAEAAYETTLSYTTVPAGGNMTAEEAVDIVRSRAGMPSVAATLPDYDAYTIPNSTELDSDPAFRLLYRNERAVELAYEGSYWYDIRRWKRAHLKDGAPIEVLNFDLVGGNSDVSNPVDDATVVRIPAENSGTFVFKEQHYWMPFRDDMIFYSENWEQNPGW